MKTRRSVAALVVTLVGCGGSGLQQRQADVAAVGSEVMPFDLDRSTHVFEPLEDGGLQTIVSDDQDAGQVVLIRSHLSKEAERFSRGDFHDPSQIHGDDMAGLHVLVAGHDRMTITYRDVLDGGEVRYLSADPEIIGAIHAWFEAQVRDHGVHAQDHR